MSNFGVEDEGLRITDVATTAHIYHISKQQTQPIMMRKNTINQKSLR